MRGADFSLGMVAGVVKEGLEARLLEWLRVARRAEGADRVWQRTRNGRATQRACQTKCKAKGRVGGRFATDAEKKAAVKTEW